MAASNTRHAILYCTVCVHTSVTVTCASEALVGRRGEAVGVARRSKFRNSNVKYFARKPIILLSDTVLHLSPSFRSMMGSDHVEQRGKQEATGQHAATREKNPLSSALARTQRPRGIP